RHTRFSRDWSSDVCSSDLKLAIYQMVFVGLSLILAMTTSLVNGGFHFILTYPILGLVTFLFYKDIKLVFYLATIPLFIWSIAVRSEERRVGKEFKSV